MNPDDLIMKYIDGDLSYSEDKELRKLMSQDTKIKADFDLDVHIHSAIKDDAKSIAPSSKLISSTEDMVLMKILANHQVYEPRINLRTKAYAFVSIVVALILLNFIYFSDNYIDSGEKLSNLKKQLDLHSINTIPELEFKNDFFQNRSEQKNRRKVFTGTIQENSMQASNIALANLEESNKINLKELTTNQDGISKNFSRLENEVLESSSNQDNNIIINNNNFGNEQLLNAGVTHPMLNIIGSQLSLFQNQLDFYTQSSDIQFASFFGTDIYRNGIPDKKIGISHISQSVSYSINNTQRIGIEVGYTEYAYEQTVNVLVPIGSINDEKFIITKFNNENDDELILYPIKLNKNQKMFWGAAFYEESLLSNQFLSLVGRIGGGTTSDGPIGYSRFFARLNLLENVSISLGTEGRIFLGRVPELNSEKSWKSSVSLIYGLQFKF